MLTLTPKPIGLIFGSDHRDLLDRLSEKFAPAMEFKVASENNFATLLRSHNVRLAIVLWSQEAAALAHKIQAKNPSIDIILERNRRGFKSPVEKNGFAALFDKAQGRGEVIRQVEDLLADNRQKAVVPASSERASLNTASFVNQLPHVSSSLGNRAKLGDQLLNAVLTSIRSNKGGLFILDEANQAYAMVSSRNMAASVKQTPIDQATELCAWIAGLPGVYQSGEGRPTVHATQLWNESGCNAILPLMEDERLLGWFLLNVHGAIGETENELLHSIGFFAAESLKHACLIDHLREERDLLEAVISKTTDAAFWVDDQGIVNVLNDEKSLLKSRGPLSKAKETRLNSSALKSALHQARNGEAVRFSWSENGTTYCGKAEPLSDHKTFLRLQAQVPETIAPGAEEGAWSAVVLAALTEKFLAETDTLSNGNGVLLREVPRLLTDIETKSRTANWLLERLQACTLFKVTHDGLTVEKLAAMLLQRDDIVRLFLLITDALCQKGVGDGKWTVALSGSKRGLELSVGFPNITPSGPVVVPDISSLRGLALLGEGGQGIKLAKAAFGFRVLLSRQKSSAQETNSPSQPQLAESFVIQNREIVLQNDIKLAKKFTNGIHQSRAITGTHH